VSEAIEKIEEERRALKPLIELDEEEIQIKQRLDAARTKQDELELKWEAQLSQIEMEEQLATENLRLRWAEARDQLAKEWNSEKRKDRFNKPSTKLIDLRRTALRLLTARRFHESTVLAKEIAVLEKVEARDALDRMERGYSVAIERLDRKFASDFETLHASFVMKRNQVERCRNVKMLPVARKVDKYVQRDGFLKEKRKVVLICSRPGTPGMLPSTDVTIASKGAKLQIPDLKPTRRTGLMTRPCSVATSGTVTSSSATGRCSRLSSLSSTKTFA
jgi:hypothetical protein